MGIFKSKKNILLFFLILCEMVENSDGIQPWGIAVAVICSIATVAVIVVVSVYYVKRRREQERLLEEPSYINFGTVSSATKTFLRDFQRTRASLTGNYSKPALIPQSIQTSFSSESSRSSQPESPTLERKITVKTVSFQT